MRLITRRLLRRLSFLLLLLAAWPVMAYGVSLFKGVMPGKVAEPHLKVEESCFECHAALKKSFTDKCVACHKAVGADRQKKRGFHGKTDTEQCERCHTEHKGREFKLVAFDTKTFDHTKTEYLLEGKHRGASCERCHLKAKFRETPVTCVGCHRQDDYHKGTLGDECRQCHVPASWKEIRFDHAKTRFPLEGKHQPVKCEQCHTKGLEARDTPTACVACHRKDDPHKMILGERCESCHQATDWKRSTFNHDKTRYPLVGKHRPVECLACHKTPKLSEAPQACLACHKKDDRHKGALGTQCADCHTPADWKQFRFDHSRTRFPLAPKHSEVACEKCHANERFKDTPMDCAACHKTDDYHKGLLGPRCESCHVERGWKETTFDHDKTAFRLRDGHLNVKCETCHSTPKLKETPTTCNGCHQKDDVHKAKLGDRCEQCHNAGTWKKAPGFDHRNTEFPLRGKHEPVTCEKCHTTKLFADTTKVCVECHKKDDEHKSRFGRQCERCHSDQTWERKDFDHQKEAGYALVGAHRKVNCLNCHLRPLYSTKTPQVCGVCHRNDDAHDGALGPRCDKCHTVVDFAIRR